jgi:hypothetical protein
MTPRETDLDLPRARLGGRGRMTYSGWLFVPRHRA